MPSNTDLAWAAGIIEGEGHLYARVNNKGTLTTRIDVSQNNVDLLYRLRSMFACGTLSSNIDGAVWTVCGTDAERVLEQTMRFMTVGGRKHRESILWMDLRSTIGPRRLTERIVDKRKALVNKLLKVRHLVDNRLATL